MKSVLKVEQIRAAEREAMQNGVEQTFLRMDAALAIADGISARAGDKYAKTAVFCGSGGNGADGLIAASRLHKLGYDVCAYIVGDKNKFDKSALAFAENAGVRIESADKYKGGANIIVDAIFGIGLNRNIDGFAAELIEKLNASKNAFKLAVDIPSGLNADTGEIMGVAFKADVTLSFSCYKLGMLFEKGRDVCGKIVVDDIGVVAKSVIHVFDGEDFEPYVREKSAHKGTAGRVYIIGGCGTMIGAPIMAGASAHAAYLNGAGTVTVCLPAIHRAAAASRATMSMMKFLSDTAEGFIKFDKSELDDIIKSAAAIDIGIGMGNNPDLKRIVKYICENFGGTLIIDADGINAIKGDYTFLKSAKARIIITPHVGEFERLTNKAATVENAAALAREINGIVVLKSATTIITDGREVRLNVAGTPAMAKGGMGDVLGGCITALSCAYNPFDAASVACYRNGMGAERAVSSYAEMMLSPRDVLNYADYAELEK
ncbi:MAG: NAD(P)H-hydrate dehydratase [Clostridiales bacterium]|nr:NAD(P)H-hydrate dehydratase [Clostridiales bacterium]